MRLTRQGVRNLNGANTNGKIAQEKCKHIDTVPTGLQSERKELCLNCGLITKLVILLIALLGWPQAASAQINPRQPRVCLATVFANIDKNTGKVEKMAGERFACTRKKTSPKAYGIAHRFWPCGTRVLLVNARNGRSVIAPVIDRGPYWAVPRSCSRDAIGFASHGCWRNGKPIVKKKIISRRWVFGNCVDVTPPVARALRLRGKEPVIIYRLPRKRYNW